MLESTLESRVCDSSVCGADALSVEVIINNASGAKNKKEVRRRLINIFALTNLNARISIVQNGQEVAELASRAAFGESRIIVAGGGDGTICAVATALIGTDKILGVLPLGTFNYFARNLSIPLDLEAAALNIASGKVASINVCEINKRIFLNNASIGLYPDVLRVREKGYRRWGRSQLVAYLSVLQTVLRANSNLKLGLKADGNNTTRQTPLVFAMNNSYQLQRFGVEAGRACLNSGKFAVYVVNPLNRWRLLKLTIKAFLRRLQGASDFRFFCTEEMSIETPSEQLYVAADGEVRLMKTPLRLRVLPDALKVIIPEPPNKIL